LRDCLAATEAGASAALISNQHGQLAEASYNKPRDACYWKLKFDLLGALPKPRVRGQVSGTMGADKARVFGRYPVIIKLRMLAL
jgi:hypothetical protein